MRSSLSAKIEDLVSDYNSTTTRLKKIEEVAQTLHKALNSAHVHVNRETHDNLYVLCHEALVEYEKYKGKLL